MSSETPLTQVSVVIKKIHFCPLIFPAIATSYSFPFTLNVLSFIIPEKKFIYDEIRQDMYGAK